MIQGNQSSLVPVHSGDTHIVDPADTTRMSLDSFPDDFEFGWTDEDSDYLTSQSLGDSANLRSQWYASAHCSRDASCSGSEAILSPSPNTSSSRNVSPLPRAQASSESIPQPPFSTPPKLRTVEQVMKNNTGTDVASLRKLTTALAREAIFGREELAKKSLTGRNNTEQLEKEKLNYIKTLVHSRVPNKSNVDFEDTWKWCRGSLSKSCQTLRNSKKRSLFD